MEYRFLGKSGLRVSAISLGGWITFGGHVDESATTECMQEAYSLGVNFFDTAEVYAEGRSEIFMGNAIKKLGWRRNDIVISTKIFWAGKGPNNSGLSRKHVVEGLSACLKRLQLDYVDVVFAHRPDVYTPMEEIVRAFNWVIEKGWAFYWGTSEWSAEQITEAWAVADRLGLIGPLCEQPQYNALHRERFENEYAPLYEKRGLGTTIWSPLAGGLLSGKYNAGVPEDSRLARTEHPVIKGQRDMLESEEGKAKLEKIKQLGEVAKELGCTTAQLSLAWCLSNKNVSTVIIGASRPEQIQENIKALKVKLDAQTLERIENILGNKPQPPINFRGN